METTEIINGFTVTGTWKNGQKSMTVSATKGGKKYFLKKYTKFVLAPVGSTAYTEETRAFKKQIFDEFVKIRQRVITQIEPVAGTGGNVVIPKKVDSFVHGEHYYEATEFIEGVIPDDEMEAFLQSLSHDEIMLMMKTAAGAMSAVHGRGIIHSDIKMKNIILVKNGSSRFVAKLIDFDSSYPADEKKFIGGDEAYLSPELAEYVDMEEEAEEDELAELLAPISPKTDIFSLGVIFHYYLSRAFPTAVTLSPNLERMKAAAERAGKAVNFYAWQLVCEGCELKLSDDIKSVNLKSLIRDMLERDPEKRPTAAQVLYRLKQSEPTVEAPWPEHDITLDSKALSDGNVVGLKRIPDGKKYELVLGDGHKSLCTKEDLIARGYAKAAVTIPKSFSDVWPEHAIAFDEAKLSALGFVGAAKEMMNGKKGYKLFRRDGSARFFTVENLLGPKYAKRTDATAPAATRTEAAELDGTALEVWPGHAIEFVTAKIKERQFVKVEKGEMNGVKGYFLTNASGLRRFMRMEMLVTLGMAKRI